MLDSNTKVTLLESLNIHLPKSENIPILPVIDKILRALVGPLIRYDARANAANEVTVQDILEKKLVDSGHGLIPRLEEIKNFEEITLYSDLQQRIDNLKQNLEQALNIILSQHTAETAASTAKYADIPIDSDWFARWRHEAGGISKPELQAIWARILAEEAIKPGRISYRTLDIVKNLSKSEAELFARVAKFTFNGNIIPYWHTASGSMDHKNLVCFAELQELMDTGLVLSLERVANQEFIREGVSVDGRGFRINIRNLNPTATKALGIIFSGVKMATPGIELLAVADIVPPSDEELEKIFEYITLVARSKYKGVEISLWKESADNPLFQKNID